VGPTSYSFGMPCVWLRVLRADKRRPKWYAAWADVARLVQGRVEEIYKEAGADLIDSLGEYCSYCESRIPMHCSNRRGIPSKELASITAERMSAGRHKHLHHRRLFECAVHRTTGNSIPRIAFCHARGYVANRTRTGRSSHCYHSRLAVTGQVPVLAKGSATSMCPSMQ
jgi:hypothetical protein